MRIAIIGGIGSGKSEVLKVARDMGFYCLSADKINAELLEDSEYISMLAKEFPECVANEKVDKKALAQVVFNDRNKLDKLNAIAHPLILSHIDSCDKSPLAVELPVIPEGALDGYDEILLVKTPILTRLKRLKGRGLSIRNARARIKAQPKEKSLRRRATVVIKNSGTREELRFRVAEALNAILAKNGIRKNIL